MLSNLVKKLKEPQTINDIIGQDHLLDDLGLIRRMVDHQVVSNLILYGPPGVGKSSLAKVLVKDLNTAHSFFNPVIDSKQKLINIIELANQSTNYIIVIDEIHRLNKDKQDILLPIIEAQKIKVIATTTENPFFVINPALRSRCQLLTLKPLTGLQIKQKLKSLVDINQIFSEAALEMIVNKTNGDLRIIINTLELISLLYHEQKQIDVSLLERIMQEQYALGSSDGDEIHDLKSAFHKSLRGSDPDASLYYLMRLIQIGDFDAIYRRMLVCVYEDIGLANVNLALRVEQGINTSKYLGHPENEKILANLVVQISLSPKSNSTYLATQSTLADIKDGKNYPIPNHIRDSHYASAIKLGVFGYKYPHDFTNNYVKQNYLPKELVNKKYYVAQNNQNEQQLNLIHKKFTSTSNS
ncbi:replication-associated recombination protein A [Ureaplasma diversum]|uniref:ATPase, AAA family n=1 Tax=Ureaplasma diversum NCTC 246 TaxID=1188241 RepID=A0A084EZ83_9BACT|nr:replication-associated recombination protein A [Ureaplasma diversum]KEZ23275.1 ATPase, AAA family [Ureaplasma diversum NCTC 246]